MREDFIAAGLHVGWIALRRAAIPDTCGQAMEVPDSILKITGDGWCWVIEVEDCNSESAGDQDDNILTPGAAISGCTANLNMLIIYEKRRMPLQWRLYY